MGVIRSLLGNELHEGDVVKPWFVSRDEEVAVCVRYMCGFGYS